MVYPTGFRKRSSSLLMNRAVSGGYVSKIPFRQRRNMAALLCSNAVSSSIRDMAILQKKVV
jgi:hypothetical protein